MTDEESNWIYFQIVQDVEGQSGKLELYATGKALLSEALQGVADNCCFPVVLSHLLRMVKIAR